MKLLALLLLVSGFASAQAVRECTDEILTCEIWEQLPSGGKVKFTSKTAIFDGYNYDEPSVEKDECGMTLYIEGKDGLLFVVDIGDSDYVATVYNLRSSDFGRILDADAAFPVVKGKPFYFRKSGQILQCKLN